MKTLFWIIVGSPLACCHDLEPLNHLFSLQTMKIVLKQEEDVWIENRKPKPEGEDPAQELIDTKKATQSDVYTKRIEAIYQKHNPDKAKDVATLLARVKGSEHDLYVRICKKYNEKPFGMYTHRINVLLEPSDDGTFSKDDTHTMFVKIAAMPAGEQQQAINSLIAKIKAQPSLHEELANDRSEELQDFDQFRTLKEANPEQYKEVMRQIPSEQRVMLEVFGEITKDVHKKRKRDPMRHLNPPPPPLSQDKKSKVLSIIKPLYSASATKESTKVWEEKGEEMLMDITEKLADLDLESRDLAVELLVEYFDSDPRKGSELIAVQSTKNLNSLCLHF